MKQHVEMVDERVLKIEARIYDNFNRKRAICERRAEIFKFGFHLAGKFSLFMKQLNLIKILRLYFLLLPSLIRDFFAAV